jgi:FkbM family methyltransferase
MLARADPLWALVRPVWQAMLRRCSRRGYAVDLPGLGSVRLPASFLSHGLDTLEVPTLAAFRRELKPDTVFYDVGASTGLYSLVAQGILNAQGEIHAFEPDDPSLELYARHFREMHPHCALFLNRCFAADNDTAAPAAVRIAESARLEAGAVQRHRYLFNSADTEGIASIRLDSYVADGHRPPSVIKIDVEGAELLVLRGLRETLRHFQPILFVSVHPGLIEQFGQRTDEIGPLLDSLGYQSEAVSSEGEIHLRAIPRHSIS